GAPVAGEADASALRARLEAGEVEEHARLRELFVELAHRREELLVRHRSRFAVLRRLYEHHETHRRSPSGRAARITSRALLGRRTEDGPIDTRIHFFVRTSEASTSRGQRSHEHERIPVPVPNPADRPGPPAADGGADAAMDGMD